MRISMIGCGYLGAVHAAAMAELGHDVIGIDIDERKVAAMAAGEPPFYEPGLPELLARNVAAGRLRFSTDFSAIRGCQVHFIGVGTPQREFSDAADLSYLLSALDAMQPHLGFFAGASPQDVELVVGKSTVPVGTAGKVAARLGEKPVELVWNPEFLREGFAVADTLEPDRLVYGVPADAAVAEAATAVLDAVYAPIIAAGTPRLVMDYPTAELVKVSANAFLATKISFINAVAEVCDASGANVTQLAQAIGLDDRIGSKFLRAGIGFGGGCLPKDIRAFRARAEELGVQAPLALLRDVDSINESAWQKVRLMVKEMVGAGSLSGVRVAVLGCAFKPDSDDIRHSPSLRIAAELAHTGADVRVHDPIVQLPEQYQFAQVDSVEDALRGVDIVVLGTEWRQYRELDPAVLVHLPAAPRILDGRNALDADAWKAAGWTYRGIGRR